MEDEKSGLDKEKTEEMTIEHQGKRAKKEEDFEYVD